MGKTILIVALVVLAFYIILIWTGQAKNPISKNNMNVRLGDTPSNVDTTTTVSESNPPENTCIIKDAYGRSLEIKGDINDPQFQRLCQMPYQQQLYVYNWPYYFYGFSGVRRHHGGHK